MFKAALSTIKDALPEEVKEAAKKRVNQWKGISPDEALVREATNSDKWGPHGEHNAAAPNAAPFGQKGYWSVALPSSSA